MLQKIRAGERGDSIPPMTTMTPRVDEVATVQPMSQTTRRTHERLVRATREEIEATGSFSAERVALRSGHSVATFYCYFPTKVDALAAAFQLAMEDLLVFCEREFGVETLLEAGLETRCQQLTTATVRFFQKNRRVFRCALAAIPTNARLGEIYRASDRGSLKVMQRFVLLGQGAGLIREGDPKAIGRALLVLLQGLNNPAVLRTRARDPLRRELAATLHQLLTP